MSQINWSALLLTPMGMTALIAASASAQTSKSVLAQPVSIEAPRSIEMPRSNRLLAQSVSANDSASLESETLPANPSVILGQVTSVSQLSDVRPTDWAFQALQSLVERYGCIVGYPDKTFRGNRALTRFEFAAGLNACLDRVNELIAASTADLVKKEDLATLQKLQEEFATELATILAQPR
jgi:predicted PhzF superfamily epimerase YddE/YHI9